MVGEKLCKLKWKSISDGQICNFRSLIKVGNTRTQRKRSHTARTTDQAGSVCCVCVCPLLRCVRSGNFIYLTHLALFLARELTKKVGARGGVGRFPPVCMIKITNTLPKNLPQHATLNDYPWTKKQHPSPPSFLTVQPPSATDFVLFVLGILLAWPEPP